MRIRFIYLCVISLLLVSCSNKLEAPTSLLTQVIKFYEDLEQEQMVAFATAAEDLTNTSYIYFYPVEGATNFQFFETSSDHNVSTNLNNYNVRDYEIEDVFGGRLKRFVRTQRQDVFCIVTYQANGVFFQSLPIQLKNQRNGTTYTSVVAIDQSQTLMPNFSWTDQGENTAYLQVVSDINENFLSGTFTTLNEFQYGSPNNVVANLNVAEPPSLVDGDDYNFTLFAIDNGFWADFVIERTFRAR